MQYLNIKKKSFYYETNKQLTNEHVKNERKFDHEVHSVVCINVVFHFSDSYSRLHFTLLLQRLQTINASRSSQYTQ